MGSYKWYGKFKNDGKTYSINTPETPRHWYNYFFNDEYVTFTSQVGFGEGLAQDDMGRRINVLSDRNIFVSDGNETFSLFALPLNYGYKKYKCDHSNGYTDISLEYAGIKSNVRIFVPNKGKYEIWRVSLSNLTDSDKSLKLITFANTEVDGRYRPQGYNLATGGFMKDKKAVYGKFYDCFYTSKNIPLWVYMSSGHSPSKFDSRKNAFIGPYGTVQMPRAITKNLLCQNSCCNSEKLCLALQNNVLLKAHEEKTLDFYVGCAVNEDEILIPTKKAVDKQFYDMVKKYEKDLSGVEIHSPWKEFNYLINGWMKYASDMGSRWARVRHNGYRDMTSDTECLACVNPKLAYERIKRVLSYQYSNGYAPRTIIDGGIRDRNFADNTVWITFAVNTIINELGDYSLYDDVIKFNDGTEATLFEHVKRSVDFLYNFQGLYGLVKIWGGDWNDCVNYAGLKGKGVSVWLSIAWVRAAKIFADICKYLGKKEDRKTTLQRIKTMEKRIDKYGWDGEYYIYARTDDDIVMGSKESEQGKIFLIPQLWAVLADVGPKEKIEKCMDSVEKYLEINLGTRLAYPAYSKQYDYIGSMAEKAPGVQDNGGIYLHPSAWKLACDSIMHRSDRVEMGLRKMLVWDETYETKCGEPYAFYNSYFAPETGYRYATPGQSWRTAASSWLLKSTIEFVFGLHPTHDGLLIDPCLPDSWNECSIKKVFRGTTYNIEFTRVGKGNRVERILCDGEEIKGNTLKNTSKEKVNVKVTIG